MTTALKSERHRSLTECTAERVGDVQAFFARAYNARYRLATDEALFSWQFGGVKPLSPTYHVRLASPDNVILGALGYLPVDLSVAGQTIRAAWGANWVIDPSQRRLGLGPLLMWDLMRSFDAVLCVGLSLDAQDLLTRMGWTDLGALHRYVCVLDARATSALTGSGRLAQSPIAVVPASPVQSVQRIERFGEDASMLWDAFAGDRIVGTRRTAEFLNWRYAGHPVFRYHMFEERRDGRVAGIAVYRIETAAGQSTRIGRMVELIAVQDVRALISAVLRDAAAHDVAMLDFFCATPRWSTALSEFGFVSGDDPAVSDVPMLFQPIDRSRREIRFMASLSRVSAGPTAEWYVTKGDGDQDRPN